MIVLLSLAWVLERAWFVSHAVSTSGTVIAVNRPEGSRTFHPAFVFTNTAGVVCTKSSAWGSSDYAFEPGEKVTVLYEAADSDSARIGSFQVIWQGPVLVLGLALIFTFFAGCYFWLARHRPGDWPVPTMAGMLVALMLIGSTLYFFSRLSFVKNAARAQGQIIATEERRRGSVYAIFTFLDASGNRITQGEGLDPGSPQRRAGDKVPVLYDVASPKHALLDSFASLWLGPLVFGGFTLLLGGVFALVGLISSRRNYGDR